MADSADATKRQERVSRPSARARPGARIHVASGNAPARTRLKRQAPIRHVLVALLDIVDNCGCLGVAGEPEQ